MEYNRCGLKVDGFAASWRLTVGRLAGETVVVEPEQLREFAAREHADGVELRWRGHAELGARFTVVCRWRRGSGGLWRGRIAFSGNTSPELWVEELIFPVVSFRGRAADRLLLPQSQGYLTGALEQLPDGALYDSSCYPFQFAAVVRDSGRGLYFAQYDARHYRKRIGVGRSGLTVELANRLPLPVCEAHRRAFKSPFDSVVGRFSGTWEQAAELYRRWAVRQRFARRSAHGAPLRAVDVWVWNRGRAAEALPPVKELARRFSGRVALDWYWWHRHPYDVGFPEFWPPREAGFAASVAELKAAGIFTQVYTNGMIWDTELDSYRDGGGAAETIVQRDGTARSVPFNRFFKHEMAFICGEAPRHQARLTEVIGHLAECGLDGVYLDMIGNMSDDTGCWHPGHRHPKNGGVYFTERRRNFLQSIRRKFPQLMLSTEDCTEKYLDCFDGMIVVSPSLERLGGFLRLHGFNVPVFSYLHHGRTALFGNYAFPDGIPPWEELWPPERRFPAAAERAWPELYPEQFFLEFGRTVIWGMQPMVCNLKSSHFTDPRLSAEMAYLLAGAEFFRSHRPFLADGRMLPGELLDCERVQVKFLRRSVYTTPETLGEAVLELPAVLHSRWRDRRGREALVLCNYTTVPQKFACGGFSGTLESRSFRILERSKTKGEKL